MHRHDARRVFLERAAAASAATAFAPLLGGCASAAPKPTDGEMPGLTSSQALAAIRQGSMSAESHLQVLLARAQRLAGLNAFITLDGARALAAARRIDARRAAGEPLPALAGLPIVVKDNIDLRGLPTTGGTPALRDLRPSANAPVLQRLVDAGAIVLGKTNMHELAFGITSTNLAPFAGPVKNPYDETRIAGGSSGGTAAAIAARIVPAGLGTDTGGSTRVPAALCGIVGLRPSVGNGGSERRYAAAGVLPISHTRDTIGPMGRTVADVALLDSVITSEPIVATPATLRGLRLGVPATFWSGLDHRVAAVTSAARARLERAGVVLVDVDTIGLAALNQKVSLPLALHEPIADIPAYLAAAGASGITLADIAARIASPDVRGAFGAILGDAFGAAYPDAIRIHRPAMQRLYARYFDDHRLEAMLFPTTILPAVPIDLANGSGKVSIDGGAPTETFGAFIRNTDPGSNAGIPGLSLPAGSTTDGLPVGLELDGPLASDRRLLGIGLAIEALLGTLPAPPL